MRYVCTWHDLFRNDIMKLKLVLSVFGFLIAELQLSSADTEISMTGSNCGTQFPIMHKEVFKVIWKTGMAKECNIQIQGKAEDSMDVLKICMKPGEMTVNDCDFRTSVYENSMSKMNEKKRISCYTNEDARKEWCASAHSVVYFKVEYNSDILDLISSKILGEQDVASIEWEVYVERVYTTADSKKIAQYVGIAGGSLVGFFIVVIAIYVAIRSHRRSDLDDDDDEVPPTRSRTNNPARNTANEPEAVNSNTQLVHPPGTPTGNADQFHRPPDYDALEGLPPSYEEVIALDQEMRNK